MAVCGCPSRREPSERMVRMATRMVHSRAEHAMEPSGGDEAPLGHQQRRGGGRHRKSNTIYDLWGDTVEPRQPHGNRGGLPDSIQVRARVYEKLRTFRLRRARAIEGQGPRAASKLGCSGSSWKRAHSNGECSRLSEAIRGARLRSRRRQGAEDTPRLSGRSLGCGQHVVAPMRCASQR